MFTKRESRVVLVLATLLLIGTAINLYGRLRKGEELNPAELIRHPSKASESAGKTDAVPMMSAEPDEKRYSVVTGKIKINSASAVELISLPGIGPVLAQRIVEYRESGEEFAGRDDLIKIRGIGQKNVEKIMPHIKFE